MQKWIILKNITLNLISDFIQKETTRIHLCKFVPNKCNEKTIQEKLAN